MSPLNFNQRVYELVKQIPPGRVATYGQIALLLGSPRAARAVGTAVARNPYGPLLPCHRVLNRTGCLAPAGTFGAGVQRQRLMAEGIPVVDDRVDLHRYQWSGPPQPPAQPL